MRATKLMGSCGLLIAMALAGCGQDSADKDPNGGNDPAKPGDPSSGDPSGTTPNGEPGSKPGSSTPGGKPAQKPVEGETDFVSADQNGNGQGGSRSAADSAETAGAPAAMAGAAGNADTRTVERGDVYRVLDDHRILNLNQYRGVQIIDVSDVSAPRVEGRLAVTGYPVELYVVGTRAIVLLNNWQGYYGTRDDIQVQTESGGLVMSVDLSDRAHPALLDQAVVPGDISTSRLTQGGGQAALYVAANDYDPSTGAARTVVKSFDVTGDKFKKKSELDLGGYVQDIQATTDVLLVAAQDWSRNSQQSTVTVVDISSPDGTMVKGGTITAAGTVQNKFNMDAYEGVLRVVSGVAWNGTQENHLETFDLSDMKALDPIDHCTFGSGEMLNATLFLQERAFFVTFFRKDPFHSFSIDAQGRCIEHNEFVVSGWNDFFRPTLGDTRLIGVGTNVTTNPDGTTSNSQQLSVSLYDATDVANPEPLLARADVDAGDYSYSEAQWDDRAFSVIEDVADAKAADGTAETGLVLLPFQGWDNQGQTYVAQVQLLTFSDHTLTLRGVMNQGSAVRRSFPVEAATTANLSDDQLSLFDTSNADKPKELGRVDVAPNYSKLFVFGDYVARVTDASLYFSWSGTTSVAPPKSTVEVLERSADLESSATAASFKVPAGAELIQVGDLLVSVQIENATPQNGTTPAYHSTIDVFDLADPTHPKARGSVETDRLQPGYGYYYGDVAIDCFDCGLGYRGYGGYGNSSNHYVIGNAIAFAQATQQMKSLGQVHSCYQNPPYVQCTTDSTGLTTCPEEQYAGGVSCNTPAGGQESCTGEFYRCNSTTGDCTPIDKPAGTTENCYDNEQFRYWQSYAIDTIDLADPDAPVLAPSVKLATDEEGTSLLAAGDTLYFNFQKPYVVSGDPRGHVKHFFRAIDLSDAQHAEVGKPINVPGDVIASDGDTIYTRDIVWGDTDVRTLVARLMVADSLAHLQTSHLFEDRSVTAVQLDGSGHVLVSSDPSYYYYAPSNQEQVHKLSILDATSLDIAGEADVDSWATFKDAKAGRALYQVGSGLLVFDVRNAAHPSAQAYFPTLGWPSELFFDGSEILFAAGPYGVYRFDADVYNLLSK
jgi:hypothetical protein